MDDCRCQETGKCLCDEPMDEFEGNHPGHYAAFDAESPPDRSRAEDHEFFRKLLADHGLFFPSWKPKFPPKK